MEIDREYRLKEDRMSTGPLKHDRSIFPYSGRIRATTPSLRCRDLENPLAAPKTTGRDSVGCYQAKSALAWWRLRKSPATTP